MKLIAWLNRPYPLIENTRYKLAMILVFGLFVSLFLVIYRPFGAGDMGRHKFFYLLGFSMPVSLGLVASYFVLPRFLPSLFRPEQWQVKKEIVFITCCFLLISLLNYSYNKVIGRSIAPQRSWPEFLWLSLSVGVFPLIVWIFLVEIMRGRKGSLINTRVSPTAQSSSENGKEMVIVPDAVKSTPLRLRVEDFICAKSDNNYTSLFFLENGEVEKHLVRLALKKVESQLADHPEIVRCHRTYLVNRSKITAIKGNTRSLTIRLKGYKDTIPVSRGVPREVLRS